jgi:hypothetical protein
MRATACAALSRPAVRIPVCSSIPRDYVITSLRPVHVSSRAHVLLDHLANNQDPQRRQLIENDTLSSQNQGPFILYFWTQDYIQLQVACFLPLDRFHSVFARTAHISRLFVFDHILLARLCLLLLAHARLIALPTDTRFSHPRHTCCKNLHYAKDERNIIAASCTNPCLLCLVPCSSSWQRRPPRPRYLPVLLLCAPARHRAQPPIRPATPQSFQHTAFNTCRRLRMHQACTPRHKSGTLRR